MVDLLPAQIRSWQQIEAFARQHFHKAVLEEIRTPVLETTDLFSRGIGEETDVVGKEMYTFLDKGDRSCTLRPEGTASVVRAVVQSGLINQIPQRLWYLGPMFRYERPQAGRQRQFHQIGVEFFGLDSIESDAELIAIGWDLLKGLGLQHLTLEINSLGDIDDRKNFRDKLVKWLEERINLLDEDSQVRLKKNPLRILDTKNKETQKLLLGAPSLQESLSSKSRDRFDSLLDIITHLGIPFKVNSSLVRGLDYYCHTAFEIKSEELGAQSTVCGGGRYDGLVKQLGGPNTPAIGWAIGLERLILLVENKRSFSSISPDIYLINKGNQSAKHALYISIKLREANYTVEIDYSSSNFSKQFKRANRSGSYWAIVLGDDEINSGTITLKNLSPNKEMKDQSSSFSSLDELIKFLDKVHFKS